MKPWSHDTGKVKIGSAWEDPTLDSPILRTLPRGLELSIEEEPGIDWQTFGDECVGLVTWLIGLVIIAQLFGCFS